MSITITARNLYNYMEIIEWDEDDKYEGTDGFSLGVKEGQGIAIDEDDKNFDKISRKMNDEIYLYYENFNHKRSCMWVEEVKKRANWVKGETIYGFAREKHYQYNISWSRDKTKIGYCAWILEADGYLSLAFHNGYTLNQTEDTKFILYIRPNCLYNDKNSKESRTK